MYVKFERPNPFLPTLYRYDARTVGKDRDFGVKPPRFLQEWLLEARDPFKPNRKYYLGFVRSGPQYMYPLVDRR